MREDMFFFQQMFMGTQGFDWVTVVTLFLVGLFLVLPQLMGHTLSGRARGCFLGATWVLVVKMFVHLIRMLLMNLAMFNSVVGRGGGGGPGGPGESTMAMVTLLFFPIMEGMLFVLGVVLFVAGLPGMIQREERWGPETRRHEEHLP
jgi:hypothetical protein